MSKFVICYDRELSSNDRKNLSKMLDDFMNSEKTFLVLHDCKVVKINGDDDFSISKEGTKTIISKRCQNERD